MRTPFLKRARNTRGTFKGNWRSNRVPEPDELAQADALLKRAAAKISSARTELETIKEALMVENPETYLSWDDDGVKLVCDRKSCLTGEGYYRYQWEKRMPYKLLPETAVLERAQHVATHVDEV